MDYQAAIIKYHAGIDNCINGSPHYAGCTDCGSTFFVKVRCNDKYLCPRCAEDYAQEEANNISKRFQGFVESNDFDYNIYDRIMITHFVLTIPEEIKLDYYEVKYFTKFVLKKLRDQFWPGHGGITAVHLNGDDKPLQRFIHFDNLFINVFRTKDNKYIVNNPWRNQEALRWAYWRLLKKYFGYSKCIKRTKNGKTEIIPKVNLHLNHIDMGVEGKKIHRFQYNAHSTVHCFNKIKNWTYAKVMQLKAFRAEIPKHFRKYRWFGFLSTYHTKNVMCPEYQAKKKLTTVQCPICNGFDCRVYSNTKEMPGYDHSFYIHSRHSGPPLIEHYAE